jgi:hypothetical protein
MAVHGRVAESRTHKAIGRRDGATDFVLNRFRGIGRRLRPLQVCLRVREMTRSRWVTSPQRALLEVTLQDVASRERVLAKNTHVWAIASV